VNLYSFLRSKYRKPFLGALFAVAFLSSFFILKSPAQATLDDYVNLFSGTSPGKLLKNISFIAPVTGNPTALQFDIKFNFQGSFPFKDNEDSKKWYWNHIKDFSNDGSDNVFILRICDVADTNQSNCLFSNVPHLSESASDTDAFCPTLYTCVLPDLTTSTVPRIYHYTAVKDTATGLGLAHSNIQYDKFNVLFKVKELAPLKTTGGLDTPVSLSEKFKIGSSVVYKADIWYCGLSYNGEVLPTNQPSAGIRQFNNLCGGNQPYFKIAESDTFKMPATKEEALASTPATIGDVDTSPSDSDSNSSLPVCVLAHPLTGSGTFMGCLAQVGYYLLYQPSAWIAGILGKVMDFFLGYSIDDASYRASVVITGWKLVRDISNIFFIIILIWTGFATVFDLGNISMKKVVPALIINALIINFSLFGTQVIIDVSNITARLFYNTMSVCDGPCKYKDPPNEKEISNLNTRDTVGGYKPLSIKIVDSFDPQKIFKPGILSNTSTVSPDKGGAGGFNASGISNNVESGASLGVYDSDYAGYFLIVSIIACIIMLAMAKMFFGVMFMFVGRVVGLYMSMIFSPFAVLTRGNMPLVGAIKELSWSKWISDLTSYALLAPIFVFFLYIIYAFINSDMMTIFKLDSEAGFMNTVIAVAIPMIIVYMLISYGVEIAKKYAGTAGNMLQKYATQATGLVGGAALGIATGGAAFAGRNVIGRGLGVVGKMKTKYKDAEGKEVEGTLASKWAANANNSWAARKWNNTYSASQTSSFDVRNAGLKIGGKEYTAGSSLNSGLGKLGINMKDQLSGAVGLGQDKALGKNGKPGGNVLINKKRQEKIEKDLENKVKMSHLSDDEAKAAWERYKTNKSTKGGSVNWESKVEELAEMKAIKDRLAAAEARVVEANKTGGTTAPERLEITRAKKELDDAKSGLELGKMAIIKNINDGKANNLKAEAERLASVAEKERLDKYGVVKDNKSFVAAMRAEYAEGINKNFDFSSLTSGFFGTLITSMMPGLNILSGAFGLQLGNSLADAAIGSRSKAIKSIIDKAKKTSGKGNPMANLEAKIAKYEDDILIAVNESLGQAYKKYGDITEAHLEEGLLQTEAGLQEIIEGINDQIKNLSGQAKKDALYTRQKAKNRLDRLRNSIKDLDQANKNLSDLKEKQKEKEEKEAEKNKSK
jgi:hypothetical protein